MQQNEIDLKSNLRPFPKIIINADDYGYCEERSRGIRQLLQLKCISSTTVIINAPHADKQYAFLRQTIQKENNQDRLRQGKQKNSENINEGDKGLWNQISWSKHYKDKISIGLHLNFTEFFPVNNGAHKIKVSIVDQKTNTYKGKKYIYDNLENVLKDPCLQLFLENQIHCQIQKFISVFKRRPSHIDGHNHVHVIPKFAKVICKIAKLYGIYKVRLPIPFALHKTGNKNLDDYNIIFVNRAVEAAQIYKQNGFIFPNYFIGLDTMGKDLTVDCLRKQLSQIRDAFSDHEIQNLTVEVMTHPGYSQQKLFQYFNVCSFSTDKQRQQELKMLKQLQINWPQLKTTSFCSLKQLNSSKNLVIYSKLLKSSGNLTTSLRLGEILSSNLHYNVYYMNVSDESEANDEQHLNIMVRQLDIKCIVGVNLTRTAGVINRVINGSDKWSLGWKVSYILVIAGTDANVTLVNGSTQVLTEINQSIKQCECLVSISTILKEKVQSYLKKNNVIKQVKLIPQSSHSPQLQSPPPNCLSQISKSKQYILLPTSFRKIKSPHHILPQLNQLISKHPCLQCYILGPIIDQQYYNVTKPMLKNVKYLQCLPHNQYLRVLKDALVMINCSESQGMSCAILESFQMKVPVIVRKNEGNCQIVQNGVNGFVYQNGQHFIQIFQQLLANYQQIKQTICETAYKIFNQKFSYSKQSKSYIELFETHIQPYIYELTIFPQVHALKKTANLVYSNNVHPISPVNLKIFNKFFQPAQNQFSPCFQYVDKIIANLKQGECISILDLGCGSGVFCIFFVLKVMQLYNSANKMLNLKLTFSDVQVQSLKILNVNLSLLQKICNSQYNESINIHSIQLIESDMFSRLPKQSFNIILANMPQTPFKDTRSRPDKNGGIDGFRLIKQLLDNYSWYLKTTNKTDSSNFLLILYSHMNNDNKFKETVQLNNSIVQWVSSQQIHYISRQAYDSMEDKLADFIEERVKNGQANVQIQNDMFLVPAELRLIKKVPNK